MSSLLSLSSRIYLSVCALYFLGSPAVAQVANDILTDGTTGAITGSFGGTNDEISADIFGSYRGDNVFYSFEHFHIGPGSRAALVPGSSGQTAENVIARVTGSQASDLQGMLSVEGFNEDHFIFINPNGVIFGPGAGVSSNGSFHVSTADEVVFEDGNVFSAADSRNSVLSSAMPEAFGFLGEDAGAIRVETRPVQVGSTTSGLTVRRGKTISLIGGDLVFDGGGAAFAPGGTVRLVSIRSAGRLGAILDSDSEPDTSGFEHLGEIELLNGSVVTASGLELAEESEVSEGAQLRDFLAGRGCAADECLVTARTVAFAEIQEDDVIVARDEALGEALVLRPIRRPGGSIVVRANGLLLSDSEIRSRSFGPDPGGIDIELRGLLEMRSGGFDNIPSQISARADPGRLETSRPFSTFFTTGPVLFPSGDFTTGRSVEGGDVRIVARNARLSGGARISTSTGTNGAAGKIDVDIAEHLALIETGTDVARTPTAIFANAEGGPTGSGGAIDISAGTISLNVGGAIIAQTTGDGDAGDISVHATRTIYVGPDSQIDSSTSGQRVAGGTGSGGSVTVDAGDEIILEGELRPSFFGHISTGSKPESRGAAGTVVVQTPRLVIRDGPGVSVVSQGLGESGDIILDVKNLELENGSILAESLGSSGGAAEPGNAGDIVVGPDGGKYPNQLIRLDRGSRISTRALAASGGNILLNADLVERDGVLTLVKPLDGLARQIELNDSTITTSVTGGTGSGGNIAIDPSALVLNSSSITAQADAGSGGDIFIATDFIIQSSDSEIDASAGPAGIDGEIVVQGESVLVAEQGAEAPASYLRADALLKERCAARAPGEGIGRLTVSNLLERDSRLDGYLLSWPSADLTSGELARREQECERAS